ncbi:MAG: YvcK family protein [Actinobacteria bacterium]|nr:YvcK family protein [Actinomycetota bacterium]
MKRNVKIVGIGGGTGLSTLLEGLKHWTKDITAIVTVTDDGGSSGRLRKDFNILPPGDIRNCIVSLAEPNSLISELFQYRFKGKSGLSGHSFGNLFITAMTELTGSFTKGILEASHILAIKGKVLPSTLENVVLGAKFTDGVQVLGQTKIVAYSNPIEKVFLVPDNPPAYTGVLKTCKEADIIILGPGSLFSSIIPNLLVKGVAQSIKKSKARKIYICNIMTQPGETDNFTVADHLFAVEKYLGCNIDYLIINSGKIAENMVKKHVRKNSFVVVDDSNKLIDRSRIIREDIVSNKDHVRHDPEKISRVIFESLF